MTERERLVEDVVKAAEYRTVTDPAEIRAVLDRLPVVAKVDWTCSVCGESRSGIVTSRGCVGPNRKGLACCNTLTSLTYRLSDDPQATPAGETPVLDGDKPATVGWCHEFLSSAISDILDQNTSLASRVAEVERSVAQCHSHIDEIERSAEVNSDNCGILFRDALDRDEKMQNDIAALRRDVEAMKAKRDEPAVRRVYPCGCVPCVCEDEARCNGCGAKSCGNQDVAHLATPTASPEPVPPDPEYRPATAIPNGRLAEVRAALEDARALAVAYAIGYAIQHEIDPKGEKWHPTHKDIVDRATAALTLLGDTP